MKTLSPRNNSQKSTISAGSLAAPNEAWFKKSAEFESTWVGTYQVGLHRTWTRNMGLGPPTEIGTRPTRRVDSDSAMAEWGPESDFLSPANEEKKVVENKTGSLSCYFSTDLILHKCALKAHLNESQKLICLLPCFCRIFCNL